MPTDEHHVIASAATLANTTSRVEIIGHRGMGSSQRNPTNPYTENTRASFIAAHAAGARWVEMDVLPSADGDLMLHHNHFIDIDGAVRPLWTVPTARLEAAGIERLDDLCADLPHGLGLYLELKVAPGDASPHHGPTSVQPLLAWARTHQDHRPLLVASFNPFVAAHAGESGLDAGWITEPGQPLHTSAVAAAQGGIRTLVVHGSSMEAPAHEIVLALHVLGQHQIRLWTYGSTPPDVQRHHDMGVQGFCVDDVAHAVATLAPPPQPCVPATPDISGV